MKTALAIIALMIIILCVVVTGAVFIAFWFVKNGGEITLSGDFDDDDEGVDVPDDC